MDCSLPLSSQWSRDKDQHTTEQIPHRYRLLEPMYVASMYEYTPFSMYDKM